MLQFENGVALVLVDEPQCSMSQVFLKRLLLVFFLTLLVTNCSIASDQSGPLRPISIEEDVAMIRPLAAPTSQQFSNFYNSSSDRQADTRNQIITARMYIADMEYHNYEARLTKEVQEEGLLATATSLGLTTSATLVPAAQTKTILSAIATAVTGLDKAYNEKELLSNTIQALQTQMRADRKAQAAIIYAKMFKINNTTKTVTSIGEYPLPMALSDTDTYYQAGTIASSLVGLSKTVATAEDNADQAKALSGPNPAAVTAAKVTASPHTAVAQASNTSAPVRLVATFGPDNSTTILENFLDPNGTGQFQADRLQSVTSYLATIGLTARSLPRFLNGAEYAAQRRALINKLKSDGKL